MSMNFIETRGNDGKRPYNVTFSQAILSPIASFGGLYVPLTLPDLGQVFLEKHLENDSFFKRQLMDYYLNND